LELNVPNSEPHLANFFPGYSISFALLSAMMVCSFKYVIFDDSQLASSHEPAFHGTRYWISGNPHSIRSPGTEKFYVSGRIREDRHTFLRNLYEASDLGSSLSPVALQLIVYSRHLA